MMEGKSEKLTSLICGSSASSGRSGLARSTFSRTFCAASPASTSGSNCTTIPAWFCEAMPVISFSPSSPRSCVSMGLTSSRSASSGEMPGRAMEM